jgi:hypothetical protein
MEKYLSLTFFNLEPNLLVDFSDATNNVHKAWHQAVYKN